MIENPVPALTACLTASIVPLVSFFILKREMKPANAGTIVASYGSVSASIFVRATSFLDFVSQGFSGHMIAVMALMEALAIIIGLLLIN
ncbi:MAG: sodium-dependent bicarbonate transport family permease [Flavobacteriales bacterium]|nr:sodium-dependent bicarbonate transport family permease [Flavobacteriales bacterium]